MFIHLKRPDVFFSWTLFAGATVRQFQLSEVKKMTNVKPRAKGRNIQSTPFIADTVGTSSQCPHQRESVIAGVYFSQTSVIWFFLGFNCCPFYRGVRYSEVPARRELTVRQFFKHHTANDKHQILIQVESFSKRQLKTILMDKKLRETTNLYVELI